jgi:hypothetical protein
MCTRAPDSDPHPRPFPRLRGFPVLAQFAPTLPGMPKTATASKAAPSRTTRVRGVSAILKTTGVKHRHHSHADLHSATFVAWLKTMTRVDADANGAVSIGGHRLSDSETRQLNRWRAGASPSLWSADCLAVAAGLHINAYFAFAKGKGKPAWATREPWFEVQELSRLDWAQIATAWPVAGEDDEDDTTQLCEVLAA